MVPIKDWLYDKRNIGTFYSFKNCDYTLVNEEEEEIYKIDFFFLPISELTEYELEYLDLISDDSCIFNDLDSEFGLKYFIDNELLVSYRLIIYNEDEKITKITDYIIFGGT